MLTAGDAGPPAWSPVAFAIALGWLAITLLGRLGAEPPAEITLKTVRAICAQNAALLLILLLPLAYAGLRGFGFRRQQTGAQIGTGALTFLAAMLPVAIVLAATAPWRSGERLHPLLRLIAEEPTAATVGWVAFAAVVLAPLLEELMYRVVLQGTFERCASPGVAIVGAALVFSGVHNPIDVLPLVPLALILGFVYYRTRSYLTVVTAHGLFNFTMLFLMLLAREAQPPLDLPPGDRPQARMRRSEPATSTSASTTDRIEREPGNGTQTRRADVPANERIEVSPMRLSGSTLAGILSAALSFPAPAPTAEQPDEPPRIGRKIDGFRLEDFRGAPHNLDGWADRDLLVIAFVGCECPLAKLYGPRLAELAAEYGSKDVGFVAINANQQDSLVELAHYARMHQIEFPLLKDPGNRVADQFGAERTPEVFVVDRERVVRYRGRIDDQYGVGYHRAAPTRRDLAIALDELLAGQDVSVAETESTGCHIGRLREEPPTGEITYSKHIAPIVQKHCVRCHREGEIAPFTLTSYDDVVGWTETIREVVEQQRMPPWHANPAHGEFANDRRLPDKDKELLFTWIQNGAPEGDPADLPPPPTFPEGWTIPEPDLIVKMPQPFTVPATGTVEYQYVRLDESFSEDKWVVAAEAQPGNRAVVHHLILFYVSPHEQRSIPEAALFNALAVFAPGTVDWQAPRGFAKRIPAGSRLYLQLHYTPNGTKQTDSSRAGLVFADPGDVAHELRTDVAINVEFLIPPGAASHTVEATHRVRQNMQLVSLFPHMHLRGKSFRYEAQYPDGRREILLDVPRYDFNWQSYYILAEPKLMPEGTLLHCTAVFDNSARNLVNPDPGQAVHWGDQTWDEMMVGQFEAVREREDLRLGGPRITPVDAEFDVEFRYRPDVPAEKVYLAGTFNDWTPDGHAMDGPDDSGAYTTRLRLKPGRHEYKFVIDGQTWRADPGNPEQSGFYGNSLLRVGNE